MAIYYLLDVGHAAVAELYGVPVENFPQLVARWERSFNEADERTYIHICTYMYICISRIKVNMSNDKINR